MFGDDRYLIHQWTSRIHEKLSAWVQRSAIRSTRGLLWPRSCPEGLKVFSGIIFIDVILCWSMFHWYDMFIVFTEQVKVITLGSDCSGLGSDFVALKLGFGPDIQLTKFAAESDETKMTWLNAVASHVGDETPDLIYHRTFGTGTTTQPPGHLCLRDSLSSLFNRLGCGRASKSNTLWVGTLRFPMNSKSYHPKISQSLW